MQLPCSPEDGSNAILEFWRYNVSELCITQSIEMYGGIYFSSWTPNENRHHHYHCVWLVTSAKCWKPSQMLSKSRCEVDLL